MNAQKQSFLALTLAAILVIPIATPAAAKALCVESSDGTMMIFPKYRKPRPGMATSLVGTSETPGTVATGAAYLNAAGTTSTVSIIIQDNDIGGSIQFTWTGNATLAGSGWIDSDMNYTADAARNFVVVECETATLP